MALASSWAGPRGLAHLLRPFSPIHSVLSALGQKACGPWARFVEPLGSSYLQLCLSLCVLLSSPLLAGCPSLSPPLAAR